MGHMGKASSMAFGVVNNRGLLWESESLVCCEILQFWLTEEGQLMQTVLDMTIAFVSSDHSP
jgi:hypothetical protein